MYLIYVEWEEKDFYRTQKRENVAVSKYEQQARKYCDRQNKLDENKSINKWFMYEKIEYLS
jgi:hypothetical protein